ncbi:MAG TPA: mechanosensitive ion channel domain-containing protein [Myxococcales bacterium]|jgi:MscS family membrane protein
MSRHPSQILLSGVAALLLVASSLPGSALAAQRPRSIADKDEKVNEGLDPAPADLDRSTPARSWAVLARSCKESRPQLGVHVLNLGDVPLADRRVLGPVLAQQLCDVLRATGKVDVSGLDDSALGPLVDERPANYVVVETLDLPSGPEDLWLRRIHDEVTNQHLWLLTKQTVSSIPSWYRALVTREMAARPALESLDPGLGARPADLAVDSPRALVAKLASLCRDGEYGQAAFLLDLSALAKDQQAEQGPVLARRLALVLKRLRPTGFSGISNDPAGAPERDVAVDEEVVARATLGEREVPLKLARYPRTAGPPAWLVSAETTSAIDEVYGTLGYGFAGDHLPAFFFEWAAAGVQLWQWLGLVVALLLSLLVGAGAGPVAQRVLAKLASKTRWEWDDELVEAMKGPLAAAFTLVLFLGLCVPLALAEGPYQVVLACAKIVALVAGGWLVLRLIDVSGAALTVFFKGRNDDLATAMVPVFRKVLKPVAAALVFVVVLQNMGLNVAGLLAGLGIGGIAIALAGKSTLENLFGSLAIAFDRPFKIGEFVKVGDFIGTVEEVGLRSTRIRTLDRTLVSIPNGQMADAKVENFARRDRFKVLVTLGLEYGVKVDQLKLVVDDLKKLLLKHPKVNQDGFSVRFVGYGDHSQDIEIFCYVEAPGFDAFTGIREELLFEFGRIVERAGASFAFPTQTVLQAPAPKADAKLAESALAEVERRQKAGELCIPEITEEARKAARRTG